MSTDRARAWLASRLPGSPPELASEIERLVAAVPRVEQEDASMALARAAVSALEDVASGTGGRSEALRLLAADAALTYAFEAAAEAGTAATLATRVGLHGELGRRLVEAALVPSTVKGSGR